MGSERVGGRTWVMVLGKRAKSFPIPNKKRTQSQNRRKMVGSPTAESRQREVLIRYTGRRI